LTDCVNDTGLRQYKRIAVVFNWAQVEAGCAVKLDAFLACVTVMCNLSCSFCAYKNATQYLLGPVTIFVVPVVSFSPEK